jgi:2'-5' RNA ligase
MQNIKRLFFGLSIEAPWPSTFPPGRLLEEPFRHLTLAFLGETDLSKIQAILPSIPPFPKAIGLGGRFDKLLFLPPRHSHVVAWQIEWLREGSLLDQYHHALTEWLKKAGIAISEKNSFLPHVTICRSPFDIKPWKKNFSPLPLFTSALHLYESLGYSRYQSLWSQALIPPFEEIEHAADIAFRVAGENFQHLYLNASLAIAFNFPPFLDYIDPSQVISNLDICIMALNDALSRLDVEIGSPFKAISFHGDAEMSENGLMLWEMIVDV